LEMGRGGGWREGDSGSVHTYIYIYIYIMNESAVDDIPFI
jgi:hypothetical protein